MKWLKYILIGYIVLQVLGAVALSLLVDGVSPWIGRISIVVGFLVWYFGIKRKQPTVLFWVATIELLRAVYDPLNTYYKFTHNEGDITITHVYYSLAGSVVVLLAAYAFFVYARGLTKEQKAGV